MNEFKVPFLTNLSNELNGNLMHSDGQVVTHIEHHVTRIAQFRCVWNKTFLFVKTES